MARTAARISDLTEGTLPPVCVKTGGPADSYERFEAATSPGWTWILLLFGIFPFLIAQFFSRIRVVGLVPMSEVARGRLRTFNRFSLVLLVGSVVVLAIGLATTTKAVLLTGAAMLVAGILVLLVGSAFVMPSGQVSGEWVSLSYVHPAFARELDRFYGR